MKNFITTLKRSVIIFVILDVITGIIYPAVVTAISQLLFNEKANGSIIEIDGKKYGSQLLGQQYNDEKHMWGRIVNLDLVSFTDEDGNIIGEIINVSADESILDAESMIDPGKLQAIAFDPVHSAYLKLGEKVGNAFRDGAELK